MNNKRDCKHGKLARSCEICELEAEIERLRGDNHALYGEVLAQKAEIAELRASLGAIRCHARRMCGVANLVKSKTQLMAILRTIADECEMRLPELQALNNQPAEREKGGEDEQQ